MDETAIIWAAGFLEGEGCFAWYERKRGEHTQRQLLVSAVQKDREPLDRLKQTFEAGNVLQNSKSNGRVYYRWQANGVDAARIMRTVLSLMCSRRVQTISEALDAYDQHVEQVRQYRERPTCNAGHPWSENAVIRPRGVRAGQRYCKACQREYAAKKRARLKQKQNS